MVTYTGDDFDSNDLSRPRTDIIGVDYLIAYWGIAQKLFEKLPLDFIQIIQ